MNPYASRRYIISAIFIATVLIYLLRLAYIQIIDLSYKYSAENNSRRYVTQYPARGVIYDRNGKMIAYNEAAYDIMVTPIQLKPFDTTEFCNLLNITPKYVRDNIRLARKYSIYRSSVFLKQISAETYAVFEEKMYKYPGFFVQTRTLRKYQKKIAAHVLGYVGEADDNVIKKEPYYKMGDYIGISGIEKSYETELRGKKGVNILLVDVHNRVKGSFQNGRFDTTAVAGADLTTSLDASLQEYGEYLMQNMSGSIVAIEPSTGEILAMVSMPTYDPALLIGRSRAANYAALQRDPLKPLFFRPVMAKYPPGSTFKLLNTLIGLKEGVLSTETRYSCAGGFHFGNRVLKCHNHPSPLNLTAAIAISCNAYFCNVFRSIVENREFGSSEAGYQQWYDYVKAFGFGRKLNSDVPNELNGYVPTVKYYDKFHGAHHWNAYSIISLSIGQGELGITPIQMANMAATIANRGYYYTPHVVKKIRGRTNIDPRFKEKHTTPFDSTLYSIVVEGMYQAVNGAGTAGIGRLADIPICGKTGTAQNPHGEDHSIFIAFAPRNNPKIALAVYVENGGFGATWAVPIGSLMIEKYLKGSISRPALQDRMLTFKRKI
ncbi:MAG: penicillin-binding protein 2 [Bacteroidota bacterium]|nr:penicillin-binding protein 2 [Bacteroidota bacterium]